MHCKFGELRVRDRYNYYAYVEPMFNLIALNMDTQAQLRLHKALVL